MSLIISKILSTDKTSLEELLHKGKGCYTFLNPVSYLDALNHPQLFMGFDGIFADGGLLVKAIRLLYHQHIKRWSFDMGSMAPIVFDFAMKHKKRVAIVATKQEMLEKAVRTLKRYYPQLYICYYRNGFFVSVEEQVAEARKIANGMKPDILIVGMGIIRQEEFLMRVKAAGYEGLGFTCGGFVHQTALDKVDYYPRWVNEHGLRFLYRMYKEPHTRSRYVKAAFVFPMVFLKEKLKCKC